MKLYTSSTSPYGRLVLLAALPWRELDLAIAYTNPWENPAELQALNPFSQVPVLQTDSGTVICNSPFILDFLLGHPLHTAEQTATAAFAFSLLDQLVKLFGLQKFKAENTPDHPLTERARADNVPAYIVCGDRTLQDIVQQRPASLTELQNIYGLGEAKIQKFGSDILEVCTRFTQDSNPETALPDA